MANLIRRNEAQGETPTLWDPFRAMREIMNWDPFAEMAPALNRGSERVFSPRFEVKETGKVYVFKADLPGIEEKDLEITLTGNRLTVSGKREVEQRQEGDTFYTYERSYGAFSRSFTLPDGADADHAEADLRSGVLTISVPKRPEHQPKKISLKGLGEKVKGVLGAKEKGTA
ncbi:MAG: Hsp20/alpha crystallin family protein [Myxococcales bacterium]